MIKPDPELRVYAHEQECYHELMEWRQEILEYLVQKERRRSSAMSDSLNITENSDGSFTMEWDEKDPEWNWLNGLMK